MNFCSFFTYDLLCQFDVLRYNSITDCQLLSYHLLKILKLLLLQLCYTPLSKLSTSVNSALDQYNEIVREKAISEGVIDSEHDHTTRLSFEGSAWVDAVDVVTQSEGKTIKKGKHIFGFGNRRKSFLQQPRHTLQSLLLGTRSSIHDPEKEKLKEELGNLKDVVHQMKDTQDKLMHFFTGYGGAGNSFYPQGPSWGPNTSFFPTPSSMFPPSGGTIPSQMQAHQQFYQPQYQPQFQPLQQPQQQQSGHGSASPGSNGVNMRPFLEMMTDPHFVFPDVGGSGGGSGGL